MYTKLTYFAEEVSQDDRVVRICPFAIQALTKYASKSMMMIQEASNPTFAQLAATLWR
jgi:hypothetical protein